MVLGILTIWVLNKCTHVPCGGGKRECCNTFSNADNEWLLLKFLYETAVGLTKENQTMNLDSVSAYRNICPNEEEIVIEACAQLWGMKGLGWHSA